MSDFIAAAIGKTSDKLGIDKALNKLKFLGGVIVGSQGLGLKNCNDTDIVIREELVAEALATGDFGEIQVYSKSHEYFNVYPPIGTCRLVKVNAKTYLKSNRLDLILYSEQSAVDTVEEVMFILKTYPKLDLMDKQFRIREYENLLVDRGFKRLKPTSSFLDRLNYTLFPTQAKLTALRMQHDRPNL